MACPHRGNARDHTQTRRLPIRFGYWNGFMKQYAHFEKLRIRRKYAPGINPICERIAYDIRNQHPFSCESTNTRQDGSFQAMHLTAKARDGRRLFVRIRAGCYPPLRSQSLPMSEQSHEDPN